MATEHVTAPAEIWTIRRIIEWSGNYLKERGFTSGRLDAELLLAEVLGCDRLRLYLDLERPLTAVERDAFRAFLKRRAAGEPVAYITGTRDFMGHTFHVSSSVLIPRPDTEVLVEQVFAQAPEGVARVLDIGTGSGCIALSLAKQWADAYVEAWELSADACQVALANCERLGVDATILQIDAQEKLKEEPASPFDLIVSNPPYVRPGDPELDDEVEGFEPELALYGDEDGLAFYRMFSQTFNRWLTPNGAFAVEIGHDQAADVSALFADAGFVDIKVIKDYGRRDRVVMGRRGHAADGT